MPKTKLDGAEERTIKNLNEINSTMYKCIFKYFSFSAIGKLNGGHQAAVMCLAVDRQNGNDIVVTGSKDHYIKV